MRGTKPLFTVRLTSSSDLAPLITAMDANCTRRTSLFSSSKYRHYAPRREKSLPVVWIGATKMLLANIRAT